MSDEKDLLREIFDFIQAHIEILDATAPKCERKGFSMDKKFVRNSLKELRLCVTTARKHYPKAGNIYSQIPQQGIKKIINNTKQALDTGGELDIEALRQLHDFLNYWKTFKENFEDMYGKKTVKDAQFRAYYVDKKHVEQYSWLHPTNIDENRIMRMYKKYEKAFKKEPDMDFREFIDEYIKENGWESDL